MTEEENFMQDYVIDFVKGRATDDIVSHHHDELDEFGAGEEMDPKLWNPVIRQAMIMGYIKKDVENYGLLKLTADRTGRRLWLCMGNISRMCFSWIFR